MTDERYVFTVDFEQPRALYQKVFSDTDREHLVHNVAVHIKNAKSAEVKARQRTSSLNSLPLCVC